MAALADDQRVVVGRLGVNERLTRFEHLPVEGFQRRRERRDHLLERTAHVLLRRPAIDRRERIVHAHEAELPIPEADPHRRGHEQGVELSVRLLCSAEETRVVDRERRPPRNLMRELELALPEAAPGFARPERDRSQQPAARLQRHDDVRHRLEGVVDREVLIVDGGMCERLAARIFEQDRLSAREHFRDGMRLVVLRRIAAP